MTQRFRLIGPEHCPRIGTNINGPSVIEVPDWCHNRLGKFYMYFADHLGTYIRLAYADDVKGPWRVHSPGVLDVSQTGFVSQDPAQPHRSDWPDWVPDHSEKYLYAHIASPDVHVDPDAGMVRMYVHGLDHNYEQTSRLAISRDGLKFDVLPDILGPSYLRVFRYKADFFAIAVGGDVLKGQDWQGVFQPVMTLRPFSHAIRHVGCSVSDDHLDLFFTCIGDAPERIYKWPIGLSADPNQWSLGTPVEILRPQQMWEGATQPILTSQPGHTNGTENALRDPFVFECDGHRYLFYAAGGEAAIGMIELPD